MAGLLGAHVQLPGMKFKIRNTQVTSRLYNTSAIENREMTAHQDNEQIQKKLLLFLGQAQTSMHQ